MVFSIYVSYHEQVSMLIKAASIEYFYEMLLLLVKA